MSTLLATEVSMTDDGIQEVLDAVGALAAELTEIRKDVKTAISYGVDVERLTADVVRIDATLKEIHAFMTGPPALTERLARLEVKQEKDRKTAARDTKDAGEAQEGVNVGFREKFSQLFGITGELQQASLRLFGILALGGAVVIYVLARALGA